MIVHMISHFLEHERCPLYYWMAGPADRPLIVFTHGVMMDHRIFDHQVAFFARHFQVLVWDVRGHGLSRPYGQEFSLRLAANDLAAMLDHLGREEAILVGHSMGGMISQEFTFLYPNRVLALAGIGTLCLTHKQSKLLKLGDRLVPWFFRHCPDLIIRKLTPLASGLKSNTSALSALVSQSVTRDDRLRFWIALMSAYRHEPGYRIPCPLLLTHGRYDYLVGLGTIPYLAPRWAKREPNCRYVVIPNAGHNAHQDNPNFFNSILLDFLTHHST